MMESYVTRVCRYIRCIQSAFSSAIIKIAKIVFQHECTFSGTQPVDLCCDSQYWEIGQGIP